ncbi:MAG: hypothetical protein ACE5KF_09375, partial [Kiloniellaceae bacterium]
VKGHFKQRATPLAPKSARPSVGQIGTAGFVAALARCRLDRASRRACPDGPICSHETAQYYRLLVLSRDLS